MVRRSYNAVAVCFAGSCALFLVIFQRILALDPDGLGPVVLPVGEQGAFFTS